MSCTRRLDVFDAKIVFGLFNVSDRACTARADVPGLLVEEREEILLELEILNDRLNDQIRSFDPLLTDLSVIAADYNYLSVVVSMKLLVRLTNPSTSSGDCFLATRGRDFEMMLRPFLAVRDADVDPLKCFLVGVNHGDADTRLGGDLNNTGTHETSPENSHALDLSMRRHTGREMTCSCRDP